MSKQVYVEVGNIAKASEEAHIGVDDISRELVKGYIGDDNNIARLLFDFAKSGEIILPPSVGEASYTGESLVYSGWDASNNYLICKRFDDFLFVSSNTYNYGRLQGLYVVNMKTGTVSQISSSGVNYIYALELQKNRYLISCSSIAFLYNGETETATQVSVGNTFNHMVDVGDKVIIRSSSSNFDLYLYDKQSERFTSLGLPYHDVKSTSQGVFAYALYGTSTNYKRLYKFSSSTDTFSEVLFLNANGTTASVQATYTGRIYEEKSGVVWYCVNAENSTPYFFDGTYFSPNWDGMTNQACFGYKNTPIFKLGDDECFTANKKIWVFKGNKIEVLLPHINSSNIVTSTYVPVHVVKYGRTYITQNIASTIETFNTAFYIWKGTEIEYKATTLKISTLALEIQGKVFLTGGGVTYEITGGDTNYGLTNAGSFNITAVFEADGKIYAKNNSTLYKYEDGTFKSLVTASAGNSMCTVVAGTFINVIGYYSTYNTGSESAIKTYNLITGEVKTLSTTVRYRLGQTSFISTNSKKVHDVFGNSINSYGLNISSVTDYLTRGESATYSNHNIFGKVTNTKLSLLYEIPGEWEYKTVKWDTGEDVYETKIVKGGYLEEIEVTKDGYEFKGWYKDGKKFDFTQPVNSNITLVAEWEKIPTYIVTFDTDGGSTIESQQVLKGEMIQKPDNPTKDGYYFDGWYLNGENFDFSTPVTENITLTAQWTTEMKDLILYNMGDENISVTGGWKARGWGEENNDISTAPTLTKEAEQMKIYLTSSKTYRAGVVEVANDIDFSKYGTLLITYSATTGTEAYGTTTANLCVSNRNDAYSKTNRKVLKNIVYTVWNGTKQQTVPETTVEIPLESNIGIKDLFISIRVYNSPVTVNIKNITLKKY